jgi:hypothetical protein
LENFKRRDYLEDLSVDGSEILKYILDNWVCTGCIWLRIGTRVINFRPPQQIPLPGTGEWS